MLMLLLLRDSQISKEIFICPCIYGGELYGGVSFVVSLVFCNGEVRSSRRVRCSIPLRANLGLTFDVIVAPLARWKLGL